MDLERLKQQDARAFAELVAEHQAIILGLGQSLGLRGPDLDDAAAEAFAAVYRALPRFEARAQLGTWVYRIAYRVIVKARTKRRRHATVELPDEPSATPAAGDAGPMQRAEQAETAVAVWSAVESLDERSATAVELYYRREWPLEKIADVLECPVGTVKTLLYRARERLRTLLSSQQEISP
ncbi:MAG TPA: RNA polymerase sigma factor [Tepidisphaeraceae bacterium]|nr:RNA polymerase sigma factor [Tepidisphaeraceae bacterium]